MQFLEQSQSITIRIGPFLDEDDGKTAETSLTITQADIRLSKNGGDFAQSNDSGGATHDENGWYYLTLDTTDTGTLGRLIVAIHESGALPAWREFMVVPSNVYDSLVGGTDNLNVEVATMIAAVANKIADHLLRRNTDNIEGSSDGDTLDFQSLYGGVAKLTHDVEPSGSNILIKKSDGTTTIGTQTVTTDADAEPITKIETV